MIEVKNLTKIFKSKHKEITKALDDVSFVLPDNGFVFIVGKSGSGKTTLLNMIAAVDNYNSGEIIFNGLNLNKLKGTELDYYRNENIGFIFQDYQLLDELTVFQNVKLALEFLNEKNDKKVFEALESVGLKGFESRYPKELSGGEKQRVAIARAIVKNPSVILADEPTGNLDSITSKEILNILKEISKTKLVLIVSHNIFDAHEFASYILELSYGKLIGTYKRNEILEDTIEVKDGTLRLPLHKVFNDANKKKAITEINKGVTNIVQDDKDFIPFEFEFKNEKLKSKIHKKHISFLNSFKHGFSFIKKSLVTIFSFGLIISSLLGIAYSTTTIKDFNSINSTKEDIRKSNDKYINLTSTCLENQNLSLHRLEDNSIEKLVKSGYKGKIYHAYNLFNTGGHEYNFDTNCPSEFRIVDEEYISEFTDKLEFVSLNEYKKEGVFLTDYIVDTSNKYYAKNQFDYDDFSNLKIRFEVPYVNGVINTNYAKKYKNIAQFVMNERILHAKQMLEVASAKELKSFAYDFVNFYSICFSFEENYKEYLLNYKSDLILFYDNYTYKYEDKSTVMIVNNQAIGDVNAIGHALYYYLTGKSVENLSNSKFTKLPEPVTIKFVYEHELAGNEKYNEVHEYTFDYTFYQPSFSYINLVFDRNNVEIIDKLVRNTSVTVLNNETLKTALDSKDFPKEIEYSNYSYLIYSSHVRIQNIVNKVFKLIIILILATCILSLVFYSIYMVKKNFRNIGILKSLGARSVDILVSFSLNIILMTFVTSVFYVGFGYLFEFIVERILLNSYIDSIFGFANSYKLAFLLNNPMMHLINILLILSLSILSYLFIFIKLNKFKPNELIRGQK